jgi:hypothetical protein
VTNERQQFGPYSTTDRTTCGFGQPANHYPGGLKGRGALAGRRSVVVSVWPYFARAELRGRNIPLSDRERAEGFRDPLSWVSSSDQFDRRDEK